MSVANTTVSQSYPATGSQTDYPIPFDYFINAQVKVTSTDLATSVETTLTEGIEYTIVAETVVFGVAPVSGVSIKIERSTALTQDASFEETAIFSVKSVEKSLDRMVMMIQEINSMAGGSAAGSGAFARLADQDVLAAGTVTITTDQRMLKNIQGDSGPQAADTAVPIQNGILDGQELRLVGGDNTNSLEFFNGGNLWLTGPITMVLNTVLDLFWDATQTKWIESNRSN